MNVKHLAHNGPSIKDIMHLNMTVVAAGVWRQHWAVLSFHLPTAVDCGNLEGLNTLEKARQALLDLLSFFSFFKL